MISSQSSQQMSSKRTQSLFLSCYLQASYIPRPAFDHGPSFCSSLSFCSPGRPTILLYVSMYSSPTYRLLPLLFLLLLSVSQSTGATKRGSTPFLEFLLLSFYPPLTHINQDHISHIFRPTTRQRITAPPLIPSIQERRTQSQNGTIQCPQPFSAFPSHVLMTPVLPSSPSRLPPEFKKTTRRGRASRA